MSDHLIVESSLVPVEQEVLPTATYLYGDAPVFINLPNDVLEEGLQATLQHLIPGSMGIISGGYSPPEMMIRFGNRIQTIMGFDKLRWLELGHICWFIRHEKYWNRVTGGRAYKSFQEFVRYGGFRLDYIEVEDYIRFYELFCQCVNAHLSPLPLLAPTRLSPFKSRLIKQQIEEVDLKVDVIISDLGINAPGLEKAVRAVRSSVVEEISHIVDTPDSDLLQQENERHYPPAEEEMRPLSVYIQMHLQRDALVCDHALIPLTIPEFQAWKAGYLKRRVQLKGVPDAMTIEQLEEYLLEHNLFIEEPTTVDAEDIIL